MSSVFYKSKNINREVELYEQEFFLLRDFIFQKTGIYIRDNKKYLLKNRLQNRLRELNLTSFEEYYFFLKYDPARQNELNHLYSVVSTNETSFFRNYPQLQVCREHIVPEIIQKKKQRGQNRLRIWSAGCSTGEEPYTLIMILSEVLEREIGQWDIKITANDLSSEVVAKAEQGEYTSYTLRNTPQYYIDKYFTREQDNKYKI
ncbi:MAG: CheR family methyltransferase, partial [Thermodesulfobacteriota bacterium]